MGTTASHLRGQDQPQLPCGGLDAQVCRRNLLVPDSLCLIRLFALSGTLSVNIATCGQH
jgi:hypothetical protein